LPLFIIDRPNQHRGDVTVTPRTRLLRFIGILFAATVFAGGAAALGAPQSGAGRHLYADQRFRFDLVTECA
jgi:hypothetical protein